MNRAIQLIINFSTCERSQNPLHEIFQNIESSEKEAVFEDGR